MQFMPYNDIIQYSIADTFQCYMVNKTYLSLAPPTQKLYWKNNNFVSV